MLPHVEKGHASNDTIRRDTTTIDIHDPYQTGKDTVRLNAVMDKIFKFPEVRAINRRIIKATKGAQGVSIMVSDEFDNDTSYYDFRVIDNSSDYIYHTMYDFLLEKKTWQIKVYESASDSIISLKDWRKSRR